MSHLRRGLPRQDRTAVMEDAGLRIAAVADGHGSRRHFRSETGAAFACETALEVIRRAVTETGEIPSSGDAFEALMQTIAARWREKVQEHFAGHPWTVEEKEEQENLLSEEQFASLLDGKNPLIPYGSTLCAAFLQGGKWGAVQIGDGSLTVVTAQGEYLWPMPESIVNEGNKTASLCMNDPMRDFRWCCGEEPPAALLVYTDGIDKVLPPEGNELISLLHWVIGNEAAGGENRESNLAETLDRLTQRSSIGDDLSIAGIVDADAEVSAPRLTQRQKDAEMDKVKAGLEEIENTIRFNKERRSRISPEENPEAYQQLSEIIEKKEKEAERLRAWKMN